MSTADYVNDSVTLASAVILGCVFTYFQAPDFARLVQKCGSRLYTFTKRHVLNLVLVLLVLTCGVLVARGAGPAAVLVAVLLLGWTGYQVSGERYRRSLSSSWPETPELRPLDMRFAPDSGSLDDRGVRVPSADDDRNYAYFRVRTRGARLYQFRRTVHFLVWVDCAAPAASLPVTVQYNSWSRAPYKRAYHEQVFRDDDSWLAVFKASDFCPRGLQNESADFRVNIAEGHEATVRRVLLVAT